MSNQNFIVKNGLTVGTTDVIAANGAWTGLPFSSVAFASNSGNTSNISITNDTTTSAVVFPVWSTANTGNISLKVASTKLTYNPSTGDMKSTAFVANNGVMVVGTTVTENYTIATGTNGLSVGPVTIANGATLTLSSGQRYIVL